jgi:hypothetical protein
MHSRIGTSGAKAVPLNIVGVAVHGHSPSGRESDAPAWTNVWGPRQVQGSQQETEHRPRSGPSPQTESRDKRTGAQQRGVRPTGRWGQSHQRWPPSQMATIAEGCDRVLLEWNRTLRNNFPRTRLTLNGFGAASPLRDAEAFPHGDIMSRSSYKVPRTSAGTPPSLRRERPSPF